MWSGAENDTNSCSAGVQSPLLKVVVGFGEIGIVVDQLLEDGDRLGAALRLGQNHALDKTHLRVVGLGGQVGVCQCECGSRLPGGVKAMKKLLEEAKRSRKTQKLRQLLDRAIDRVRDALAGPEPRLQPIPVRVKRRKG